MQETNQPRIIDIGPQWHNKTAWFVRIVGLLVIATSIPGIIQKGWPQSLESCGSLGGVFNGSTLFVMSFIYVIRGRTRVVITVATILLALWQIGFGLARLGLLPI